MLTIIGGVGGFMWYNYSKRSTRVETVNLQGDGKVLFMSRIMRKSPVVYMRKQRRRLAAR